MMLELNLLGFQIILKFKWIVFIYNLTAHLTVKAQVYITAIGGMAHAYPHLVTTYCIETDSSSFGMSFS
jgi:hypothetical protein